jgi:hypothetical protein
VFQEQLGFMVKAKRLQTTNDFMGRIRPSTVLCRIGIDGEKGDRVHALGLDDHGAFDRSHGNLLFRSNPECNHHFFKPTRHEFKKSKFRGHQAVIVATGSPHGLCIDTPSGMPSGRYRASRHRFYAPAVKLTQ